MNIYPNIEVNTSDFFLLKCQEKLKFPLLTAYLIAELTYALLFKGNIKSIGKALLR